MFTREAQRYESLLSCTAELTIHNFSWVQCLSTTLASHGPTWAQLCFWCESSSRVLRRGRSSIVCTIWLTKLPYFVLFGELPFSAHMARPARNLRQLGQDDQPREVPGGEDCHPGNLIEFEPCGPGHLGTSALIMRKWLPSPSPWWTTQSDDPHARLDAFLFTWEVC